MQYEKRGQDCACFLVCMVFLFISALKFPA